MNFIGFFESKMKVFRNEKTKSRVKNQLYTFSNNARMQDLPDYIVSIEKLKETESSLEKQCKANKFLKSSSFLIVSNQCSHREKTDTVEWL
jgi:hypothetical protein